MSWPQVHRFLRSATVRLTASYLGVIMVLSVAFSIVIYNASWHDLGHEIPPPSLFSVHSDAGTSDRADSYHDFFTHRIDEARGHLLERLVFLNLGVLLGGAGLSYYLARRTLQPIEAAMAAQSRFVTDASHELRTPLTSVLTSNEVALRKPGLTLSQAKQLLRSNTEEMSRLKLLSDSLLSLAKADAPLRKEVVSLQDIAGDAMNQVLPAAQQKKISIEDSAGPIKVMGNAAALTQAVSVILDNAIKYSSPKTTIYLSSQIQDGFSSLTVRDEGPGIGAKHLPHIFERFYRADPARGSEAGGHGIGLSIAQQIIEQHDGHISVSSVRGKGATFKISLPSPNLEPADK